GGPSGRALAMVPLGPGDSHTICTPTAPLRSPVAIPANVASAPDDPRHFSGGARSGREMGPRAAHLRAAAHLLRRRAGALACLRAVGNWSGQLPFKSSP